VATERHVARLLADYLDARERGYSGAKVLREAGGLADELRALGNFADEVRLAFRRAAPPRLLRRRPAPQQSDC